MNRRQFLKIAGAAAIAAPTTAAQPAKRKPNLLFLWTDEQRPDTMAVYGNSRIQTPNLNKLAEESVVFQNAYVSQPICTPSRATAMTGLWPHQNSCVGNNIPLPSNVRCIPELLNDGDYRTAYMGKWHLGDEMFPRHGFQEWVSIEDGYRKYFSHGSDRNQKSDYWKFLNELGYMPDEDGYYSRGFASKRPIEHCKPKFLETRAVNFLQRNQSNPFVLCVNFLEPHMPYSGPLNEMYDPKTLSLPANYAGQSETDEPLRYRLLREGFLEKGSQGQDLHKEEGWLRIMANYYGLVTQVDRSVGAILDELERLGLAENTIVVYTSDHGDMMGSHRLLAKSVMYEEALKVPWLMRIPQFGRRQKVVPGRFSHIDLVPTILDLMGGGKENSGLPGKSLVPVIKGESRMERDVFIQWNARNSDEEKMSAKGLTVSATEMERVRLAPVRTVITQDGWKLCRCNGDKNQLFDLNSDPGETQNLYYTGKQADKISDLSNRIQNWQTEVKDPETQQNPST